MAVLREGADDLDLRVRGRVGPIDDAERRFAARDQGEGGADVVGLRHLAGYRVPDAELLQRRLSVLAGGDRIDVRHRQVAVAEELGEVEIGLDPGLRRRILRGDQHDLIAEKVFAGIRLDQVLFATSSIHAVSADMKMSAGAAAAICLASAELAA